MKEIAVNKMCFINDSNIALAKDRKAIAINIVQEVEDEKSFINYCLAVDEMQYYCEDFSAGMVKFYEVENFEAERSIFVSRIHHDVEVDANWLEKTLSKKSLSEDEICKINSSGVVTLVYGESEELLALAYVCNANEVVADINGNTEYFWL
ncbi:MAG: hypothetical protein ACRCX2_27210 [Paraclostridium sp.]